MKKFTILVALILCVTIGGVYAAWIYPNLNNDITLDRNVTVQLSDADTTNDKGVLSAVTGNSGMSFFLDDANNNHVAEVKLSGFFEFVFTPDADLPVDAQNPITLKYTLSFNSAPTYGGQTIVSVASGKESGTIAPTLIDETHFPGLVSPHGTDLTRYEGKYYYCVDHTLLKDSFEAMTVKLDTLAKYNEVKNLIAPLQLNILLSDKDYVAP